MKRQFLSNEQKKIVWELYQNNKLLPWKTFAEICNTKLNTNFNESVFRKYIQIGLNFIQNHNNENISILKLLKVRKANTLLKQELNKQINIQAKYSVLEHEIKAQIKDKPITTYPNQKSLKQAKNSFKSHLFIIADIQEDGGGYSSDIFNNCFQQIKKITQEKNLTHIHIWENGDGIDGALRTSALAQNVKSIVGQIQIYWTALSEFLYNLSKLNIQVDFSMVTSNHTELRLFNTGRGEMKEDDVSYLIYELVQEKLKYLKNINFIGVADYKIHEYSGYKIFQHHGDNKMNVKNLEQYFKDICAYYEPIDYAIVSHVHHLRYTTVNSGHKGHDYAVITTPALDPRIYKNNEQTLMLSSQPAFLYIEFTKDIGISEIKKLHTNLILKEKPEVKIKW